MNRTEDRTDTAAPTPAVRAGTGRPAGTQGERPADTPGDHRDRPADTPGNRPADTPTDRPPAAGDDRPVVLAEEDARAWSPATARARVRDGLTGPTAGVAAGHTQANLISVPADWAYEMLLFCQRNPKPCPVLDVTDAGAVTTVLADGADLRTDLPRYRVWEHGELVDEPTDVRAHWRGDLVSFLIGCSFTFEWALSAAGVPIRHVEQGRNVPMYVTARRCRPAGRLRGPLVVSMRPVPPRHLAAAIRESSLLPAVHGGPVHCGDPAALGIDDLSRPDFGEAVDAEPDDIPVFWACGVTPQAAVTASRPPFAITHAPGRMFLTDARDDQYRVL